MPASKKPRKAHKQKRVIRDTMAQAKLQAEKLTPKAKQLLIGPVWDCHAALREGRANNATLIHLMDVFNIAGVLAEDFGLLPDHMTKFSTAQETLLAITNRRKQTGSSTCWAHELEAIKEAIEFHAIQLEFTSAGEIARATQIVDRKIRNAHSGSPCKGHAFVDLPHEAVTIQ